MVTAESIYGYETQTITKDGPGRNKEQVIIPDTTQFLQPAILPVRKLFLFVEQSFKFDSSIQRFR